MTGTAPTHVPSLFGVLLTLALTILVAVPAAAQQGQPGPEMYGVAHLFALPTATTTRQFGMGGVTSCVRDVGFPNPAFAGALDQQQAAIRVSCTDFDTGVDLTATQGWYATPLSAGEGVQILGFQLDGDRGGTTLPGVQLEMEETDVAVHYGRRLSENWLVGAGVSPILETDTRLTDPAGNTVASWDSKAKFGFRIGGLFQFEPEGYAGLVFDYYDEDVTFQPGGAPAQDFDFTSTELALGVSGRVAEGVLGAIEWMQLESKDGDAKSDAEGLHLGLEYDAIPDAAFRVGSSDGSLTFGAGYSRDGWVVNYAFIGDRNDDEVEALLGGSDTHQIEIGRYW